MVNHLNGSFNAQQARAIEKYVADFVANVLMSYEAGVVENPKEVKAEAVKVSKPAKLSDITDDSKGV